jgi:osmotically-inducible protein OsmY
MGTTKDIREAVEAELEFDPLVDDADIHVVTINGDVTLNGTIPSYPQYLEAAAAQRVAGVRNIHNHLQVVLPGEDYRDDAMLTTAANNVSVDTSGNTVTLPGHVRTWAERDAVVSAAWMAGGVMQVRDDLDITG